MIACLALCDRYPHRQLRIGFVGFSIEKIRIKPDILDPCLYDNAALGSLQVLFRFERITIFM